MAAPRGLCILAVVVGAAAAELYGIGGLAMPNGAMSQGHTAFGPLDLSGSVVTFKPGVHVLHSIHILDALDSGCGLAIDAAAKIAFTVGYDCSAGYAVPGPTPCAEKNAFMRLFGIDLATGAVVKNFSLPLPYWDNGDDHHTTLRRASNGDFVISGIMNPGASPRPLEGGVVVVRADGTVRSTQIVNQTWGTYMKGPMALDEAGAGGNYSVYLAQASIGAPLPLVRFDVATAAKTAIPLPGGLMAMSIVFDAARKGAWVVAGNATKILQDGYYLAFVPSGATSPSSVRALGRSACLSVENPQDNWSSIVTMSGPDALVVALPCQSSPGSLNQHLFTIDVATLEIKGGPMTYPVALPGVPNATAQPFGIAAV